MTRRYNSFLIRCWQRDNEGWHIDITHSQSGQRRQYTTWSPIVDWMVEHCHKDSSQNEQRPNTKES
ncbi:MAG: hypothetical protein AAGF95_10950 [Chloroflexota bacterium]